MTRFVRIILSLALLLTAAAATLADEAADAVASEFKQLLIDDEAALQGVERMMAENAAFAREGAGLPPAMLSLKLRGIVDPIRERYEAFLERNPAHVRGHLAFASYLGEFSEEATIHEHLEQALKLSPNNPIVLNNVAKYFGEHGPAEKAFRYMEQALSLEPDEPTYLRNLAGIMLVHRKEALRHFRLVDERQLFAHTAGLYRRAVAAQPDDFLLLSTFAQSLYRLDPFPYEEAQATWASALKLAGTVTEQEGVRIHLARIHIRAGRFEPAREELNAVQSAELKDTKLQLIAEMPRAMRPVESAEPAKPARLLFNFSTAPPPAR
jgi:tetratricopeptide (TPR) repeat protein